MPTQPYLADMTPRFNYDDAPMLVYWEMTQACDLACVHCRAEAQPNHNPLELSTADGQRLLRERGAVWRAATAACSHDRR